MASDETTQTVTTTVTPIEGEKRYVMLTVVRGGKTYKKKLLIFSDEEMEANFEILEELERDKTKKSDSSVTA